MKIKNSIKKKVLAALLIGTSLSGMLGKTAFADSKTTDMSRSQFVSASSPEVKRIINDMNTKRWTVVVQHINGTPYTYIWWEGKLYLYDQNNGGGFRKGLTTVKGHTCFFSERHFYGEKGWCNVNNYGRVYLDPLKYETPKNCFKTINGETFHFNDKGTVDIGLMSANGRTYRGSNRTGVLVTGWWSEGGRRYLFEGSNGCAAHTGWYTDGNAGRMYFNGDGSMAEGVNRIGNETYLFQHHGNGANSYVTTGYYSDTTTDKRYYFDPKDNGRAARNEWILTDRGYVHFGNDGAMAKGVQEIDGETFVFTKGRGRDQNYYRDLGWYNDPETHARYYFGGDRGQALKDGVFCIDGHACKFNKKGAFEGYLY